MYNLRTETHTPGSPVIDRWIKAGEPLIVNRNARPDTYFAFICEGSSHGTIELEWAYQIAAQMAVLVWFWGACKIIINKIETHFTGCLVNSGQHGALLIRKSYSWFWVTEI